MSDGDGRGMPALLGTRDLTAMLVAIVFFAVQVTAIEPTGAAAFAWWGLGFVLFLIPCALVTAQLGRMFPVEGGVYGWTQAALGPFWGFFAAFLTWWPGVITMISAADIVVSITQYAIPGSLSTPVEQGGVILAVLWLSFALAALPLRHARRVIVGAVAAYVAAVLVIAAGGAAWLLGGGAPSAPASSLHHWLPHGSLAPLGLITISLLGVEVPLAMSGELRDRRAIGRHLRYGVGLVMVGYLLVTFAVVFAAPPSAQGTTGALFAVVERGFGSHALALGVAATLAGLFVATCTVYNVAYSRLLVVSARERRAPRSLARLSGGGVPVRALLAQTLITTVAVAATFGPWTSGADLAAQVYDVTLASVTVIWCASLIVLFADVFLVRRAFPDLFASVQVAPGWLLTAAAASGTVMAVVGAAVTFRTPWSATLFSASTWRLLIAAIVAASMLFAFAVYTVGEEAMREATDAVLDERLTEALRSREHDRAA